MSPSVGFPLFSRVRFQLTGTAAWVALAIAGCANPGIPKPPSLHLPATVTDLTGARIGDMVQLNWTSPGRTTDGLDIAGPTTVEICRDAEPIVQQGSLPARVGSPDASASCLAVLAVGSHLGKSSALVPLPAAELTPTRQPRLLPYRVRILNSAGRSAAPSAPVFVCSGPAPASVSGFRATQQKAGVVLEWHKSLSQTPTAASERVEVVRMPEVPDKAQPHSTATKSTPKGGDLPVGVGRPRSAGIERLVQASEVANTDARQTIRAQAENDGMIDKTALRGATYLYTAQRIRKVLVDGTTLEMSSQPTTSLVVSLRDLFPPDPPRGLFGVPSRTVGATNRTGGHATIDLSWEPNGEQDLAGYIVYRRDFVEGRPDLTKPVRLNSTLISSPSYRDDQVAAGHRYTYFVTAIDHDGNESKASTSFQSETATP